MSKLFKKLNIDVKRLLLAFVIYFVIGLIYSIGIRVFYQHPYNIIDYFVLFSFSLLSIGASFAVMPDKPTPVFNVYETCEKCRTIKYKHSVYSND